MKFSELGLAPELVSGLTDIRFEETTPIQEKSIPPLLEGKDLIGVAQTGTGKTGAFVIPLIHQILKSGRKGIKAIILSPTRELAQQIDEQIFAIGYHTGITSATVIGGSDFSTQAKAIKAGVDIIVATPGRFMDQKKVIDIDLSSVEFLVLDEADRMLDMGFLPDMKKIIQWIPENRQTLLFSATMPKEIESLASGIMNNPVKIEIERSKPSELVEQRAYELRSNQKIPLVKQIFDEIKWDSCIIFTSTKKGTDELQRLLKKKGIKAGSIHGDRSQDERNRALEAFKNRKTPVLVATNVIARGIDIKDVSMIINYDVPRSADDYVHRIGRTGRYDRSGIAVTLVTRRDSKAFSDIEKIAGKGLTKISLPESFNESTKFTWEATTFESTKGSGARSKDSSDGKGRDAETKTSGNETSDNEESSRQSSRSGSGKRNGRTPKREKSSDGTQRASKESEEVVNESRESAPDTSSNGASKKSS
ncbi:MAG: DEAD/DEAH box helicase, partial [Balneolaceae bacterium]